MHTTGQFVAQILSELSELADVGVDLAVGIDGWVADAARTVIVGTPADDDLRLLHATEEALTAGIEAARPGNRLGDVSAAIEAVATDHGYPINTEFGGHGLGRTMHEDPMSPTRAAPAAASHSERA